MRAGELFVREMARWARLQNRANYPEVPEALLQEELQRCLDRIDRLNGAMP